MKNTQSILGTRPLLHLCIIGASVISAFAIGIFTAHDIRPLVSETRATSTVLEGDMNGDGTLTQTDILIAFSIARGDRPATPEELLADTNGDYRITFDDVDTMLRTIALTHAD